MQRALSLLLTNFVLAASLVAQTTFAPYSERNSFLLASPGAMKFGLYGYDNPALLSYIHQPDLLVTWTGSRTPTNRWGLFLGLPQAGFGLVSEKIGGSTVTDYNISLASDNRTLSAGIGYGWTKTDNPAYDRSSLLKVGALCRPLTLISTGIVYASALTMKGYEWAGDLAFRPLGNELATAFAEYVIHRSPGFDKDMWSAGVAVEAMAGVRITCRYFDTKAFSLGMQLSLGRLGLETQAHYDADHKYAYNSYGIRVGAYDRNFIASHFIPKTKVVEINRPGRIGYQRFMFFDNTQVLSNLLNTIDAAKDDPAVAGIAINTSGVETDAEKLWELREKLKEFKASGKEVFIFVDRGNIDTYHFASVADKIVMDPEGMFSLEGYLAGRTFVKGTLEKLGIGFDEWRFFKYKSAAENYSRDKMSDADREQRRKYIEDWYHIAKEDICEARHLSSEQFDELVNEGVLFMAPEAKEKGLVDSLGRWDVVKDLAEQATDSESPFVSPGSLARFNLPYDNAWGEPPHIAVIYALGVCAMDEGITARKLVKDFQAAVDDSRVKAIVLRVDSPGGDALASDYIADAMKKAKRKKPIIVSQGFVAASGGYWLSMYADTIVAAPGTITGSIGVIGGWLYNDGFKEKLGMSTDFVKIGAHADLGFGMRLPLIGIMVPDRNLSVEERARAESFIKTYYKEFLDKVAFGRKMKVDQIEPVAEGRVWTGLDGKKNGLVDVLGGLSTAVDIAKERAGIPKDQEVTIVEMPKKGLIDFSMFAPKLFGIETKTASDPTIELLKFRLEHNGRPLPMLPMEDIDLMNMTPQ
jgi:protease-4